MIPLKFVEQSNNYFCGPASLVSLLSYYGIEKTQDEIAVMCGSNPDDGTDPEGLKKCLKDLGFEPVEIVGGSWSQLREHIINNTPIIVGWYSDFIEPGDEHYSVVIDITNNDITLMDPEIGEKRTIDKEDFLRRWSVTEPYNWYLYAQPRDSSQKDNIAKAVDQDFPQILEIIKRLPEHFIPESLIEIEEDLHEQAVIKRVYKKNAEVVGFVLYKIEKNQLGEILWLGVDPAHQKQGVGKRLIQYVLDDMKNNKVEEVNIAVIASTVDFEPFNRTRKFYESFGFSEARIDKDYYGPGDDRSIMSLKL